MKQKVTVSVEPVTKIEVVEVKTSKILHRRLVKLKVTDQRGTTLHTLAQGDTLDLSFHFNAEVL